VVEGSVLSKDGTTIGFFRIGCGPAIVFVHGSISDHRDWKKVARILSPHHTCILMDRRGRGHSRDITSEYSIRKEYEDIAAILESVGPDVCLVGHSFGAACALGGAALATVRRLVLYEAPYPVGKPVAGEHLAPFKQALATSDLDLALAIGMERFIGLPSSDVAAARSSKAWAHMRALVKSWTRELEVMDALGDDLSAYRQFPTPTLLLIGSESRENPFQSTTRALQQTLPHVQVSTLHGQSHLAMRLAPELVAQLIAQFVAEEQPLKEDTKAGQEMRAPTRA
jgi:pimeloyl-ACP methyl ester carboxylesterase